MAKLLMISGDRSLAAGKQGAFYNTLSEFHKHWDRIDIICPCKKSDQVTSEVFGNVFVHSTKLPLFLHPIFIFKKGLELFRNNKFDLITVHEYPPFYNGIGARLLWQKLHVPYVLEVMHIPGLPRSGSLREAIYKGLMKYFFRYDARNAKAIRVINKNETRNFLIKHGVSSEKIVHIPAFYIDLDIFRQLVLPKKYDCIFVGRFSKNKGLKLFLDAIRQISATAIIVGDGSMEGDIEAFVKKHNLREKVTVYGWAKDSSEVAKLINQSKIIIMPSYNEGGPRVILESMACGTPVLATRTGIVPDVIQDGVSGSIIDWDANDIAQKAKRLLGDSELYLKYQVAGLEIVKKFEKKSAIIKYADTLKSYIR
jgi:glycosyltransferase involved in cell wall biosynthesis